MKQYVRYVIVWAINTALILTANTYFPLNYVLGNAVIPPIYAAIFAGFLLTVFDKAAKPIVKRLLVHERNRYIMFGIYWLVNAFGIWLIARLSFLSGFGISAYYFALILGLGASFGQWLGRQFFKAVRFL